MHLKHRGLKQYAHLLLLWRAPSWWRMVYETLRLSSTVLMKDANTFIQEAYEVQGTLHLCRELGCVFHIVLKVLHGAPHPAASARRCRTMKV
jgi:hypothetical protein